MSDKTRVAVVGAGFIAEYHLEILRRIRGVEVISVVDPVVDRARSLARRFGVGRSDASVEALCLEQKPDVAHVVVPPHLHEVVAGDLIDRGVSVFVEKPLATDLAAAQRLRERAAKAGVVLSVNHNNLYHPSFQHLLKRVESGGYGRIEHVFACLHVPLRQLDAQDYRHWMFQHPRNIVFEQGPHPFSQLHRLLGPVSSVAATRSGRWELGPGMDFFDTWQIAMDCERGPATVLLSFGKGFGESWLQVVTQDGAFRADLLRRHELQWSKTPWLDFLDQWSMGLRGAGAMLAHSARNAANYGLSTLKLRDRTDVFYVGMRDCIIDFHRAFRAKTDIPITADSAVEVVEACERATEGVTAPARPLVEPAAPTTPREGEVLLTGATGFVGRHLVRRLRRDGVPLRLLVRRPDQVDEELLEGGTTVVGGSLTDDEAIDRAVQGVRAVIHLATGGVSSWEDIEESMIGGCRRIAEACKRHGVEELHFTSTIAALYLGDGGKPPLTEEEGVDPQPNGRGIYARGKMECERVLADFDDPQGLRVIIHRPGVVLGDGTPVQHSGAGLWTRDSECFGWGMGRSALPLVLVEDVADAMARALGNKEAAGRAYNLVGDVCPTAREYVDILAKRGRRRFRFHGQPLWTFQAIELGKWLVKKAVRRPGVDFPSFRDLKSRAFLRVIDNSRAKKDLGWHPESDRDQFIDRAFGAFFALQDRSRGAAISSVWPGTVVAEVSPELEPDTVP